MSAKILPRKKKDKNNVSNIPGRVCLWMFYLRVFLWSFFKAVNYRFQYLMLISQEGLDYLTGCLRSYCKSILYLRTFVLGRLRGLQYIFAVIYETLCIFKLLCLKLQITLRDQCRDSSVDIFLGNIYSKLYIKNTYKSSAYITKGSWDESFDPSSL